MGAVAILRAVQETGIKPDGVIVEAVFDTMLHAVRHRFEAMGVPAFPSAELLVFWGGVETGGGEKQFKEFAAVGHESYVKRFPADWEATVGKFMNRIGRQDL